MSESISLDSTLGALQIGSVGSVYLFGIVTYQCYVYYQSFREDKWQFKWLVAAIWALELGHTICVLYEVYRTTIIFYGRPEKLVTFPVLGGATSIGGTITLLAHSFFSVRLWRVLPRPWAYIGIFCIGVAFVRFVGSICLAVIAVTSDHIATYRVKWEWLILSLLTVGAVLDIIIAASMLWYLIRQRGNALIKLTRMIDRLVSYTVCTGLLTSLCAIVMVIAFQALPGTLVWLAIYSCLAKLYSNSLLSALNERINLRTHIANSASSVERPSRQNRSSRRDTVGPPSRMVVSVEMRSTVHPSHDDLGHESDLEKEPQSPFSATPLRPPSSPYSAA
ncbi:hypothetical protein CC2G_002793 [Coprinopsis cinerea AmutBmut pab1-1]|nr:hypothetical protein CC2G_002793 [Coprinopsis cinerea AmutBmut pab1-1]